MDAKTPKRNRYAENTTVPISRSRDELERTLERFGATAQMWMRDDEARAVVLAFKRNGAGYKFRIALTSPDNEQRTPTGQLRATSTARAVADQENRRRFRSLANYVKALMDAADTGIISAEEALLPFQMLPSGETVYEVTRRIPELDNINLAKALGAGASE